MRLGDLDALKKAIEQYQIQWNKNCDIDIAYWNCCEKILAIINIAPTVETYSEEDMSGAYNEGYACGSREYKRPQGEWIPVSERLPEDLSVVNITWVNHKPESYYADIKDKPFTATGIFYRGIWYWYSTECEDFLKEYGDYEFDKVDENVEITAWQPLPEPYKGGGVE